MQRTADKPRNAKTRPAGGYERPTVVRVRIETARLKVGYQDANQFCTIHIHDDVGADCAF